MQRFIEKNTLIINNTIFKFEFDIRQIETYENLTFVLLAIPYHNHEIRNIYGYKYDREIWQVESIDIKFPCRKNLPFEAMRVAAGNYLIATDFYGRRYQISMTTGEVMGQISSTK